MNRRSFLARTIGLVAGLAVAPRALAEIPEVVTPVEPVYPNHWSSWQVRPLTASGGLCAPVQGCYSIAVLDEYDVLRHPAMDVFPDIPVRHRGIFHVTTTDDT